MNISCDRVRDLAPGFVLGALDPSDMSAVRSHIAACRRPHPELSEMGGVLPYIGEALEPVEPPRHLRAAVLAAVQAEMEAAHAATQPALLAAPAKAAPAAAEPEKVVSLSAFRALRSRKAMTWATRAAAILAIVALGGYAVAIQGDLGKAHDQQIHNQDVYNAFEVPGSRSAVLMPEKGQKGGGVAVMLPSGHVALEMHGLAPTTGDQVYGVWFSADGGPLTKAVTFTVDARGDAWSALDSVPPNSSLWVMVCREANKDVAKPGAAILTGTIWVYETPAPTPTN